jgi:hypothetical protein
MRGSGNLFRDQINLLMAEWKIVSPLSHRGIRVSPRKTVTTIVGAFTPTVAGGTRRRAAYTKIVPGHRGLHAADRQRWAFRPWLIVSISFS